jgi:hypothetical protein
MMPMENSMTRIPLLFACWLAGVLAFFSLAPAWLRSGPEGDMLAVVCGLASGGACAEILRRKETQ